MILRSRLTTASMFLFCAVVWGTSYWVYRWQVGVATHQESLLYRLSIAACVVMGMNWRRTGRRLSWRDHGLLVVFGICNFCLSYYFLYAATQRMASGLVILVFATKCLTTPLLARLVLGRPLRPGIVWGGMCGLLGLAVLLVPAPAGTVAVVSPSGIALAVLGTLAASLGDIASARNTAAGIAPAQANGWALGYSVLVMTAVVLVTQRGLAWPASGTYWTSVGWLALASSVFAWSFYLILVARMGPDGAGTMVLLFPLFGIAASAWNENDGWLLSPRVGLAILCVCVGVAWSAWASAYPIKPHDEGSSRCCQQ